MRAHRRRARGPRRRHPGAGPRTLGRPGRGGGRWLHDGAHRHGCDGQDRRPDRLVRRPLEGRRSPGGRQGRQPRRADLGGAPGPARLRDHRGRLPPGDGRGAGCGRRSRRRWSPPTWSPRMRWPVPRTRCGDWSAPPASPTSCGTPYWRPTRGSGGEPRVAVRSSATAEDTGSTSFAGMNETFTNVQGGEELVDRLVDCWASLWSPRVIAYRSTQGLADEPAIAVVVQEMVDSERLGGDVHRRPGHREARRDGDRGRLRPGRGRGRRAGRARHVRRLEGGAPHPARAPGPEDREDRARAGRARPAAPGRRGRAGPSGARRRGATRARADGDRDRAALRQPAGRRVRAGRRAELDRPVAPDHDAGGHRRRDRPGGDRRGAGQWPRGRTRGGLRAGPDPAQHGGRRAAAAG